MNITYISIDFFHAFVNGFPLILFSLQQSKNSVLRYSINRFDIFTIPNAELFKIQKHLIKKYVPEYKWNENVKKQYIRATISLRYLFL